MPVFNLANPLTVFLLLILSILLIALALETKRSVIAAIGLIVFVIFLVMHSMQLTLFGAFYETYRSILTTSLVWDFLFILLMYISYLWADDVETKARNKKSIDNSLDWFWGKIN